MKSETPKSPSVVIELSTVYFSEGSIPQTISLRDCGLRMREDIPNVLTALYGNQSKQDGFMAAREYAERNRYQFTVIDFVVALEHRINPGLMKPEEVAKHDFLSFQRLSRSTLDELSCILVEAASTDEEEVRSLEGVKPNVLLLERPRLIADLLDHPSLRHVKVVTHQAKPLMSERPLNVGSIPFHHWDAIREATCRLNPTSRVTIERPESSPQSAPPPMAGPAPRVRPKAPRVR